jgi:hypothetical protein
VALLQTAAAAADSDPRTTNWSPALRIAAANLEAPPVAPTNGESLSPTSSAKSRRGVGGRPRGQRNRTPAERKALANEMQLARMAKAREAEIARKARAQAKAQAKADRDTPRSGEPAKGNGQSTDAVAAAVHSIVHKGDPAAPPVSYKPTMADLKAAFGAHPQVSDTPEGPIVYDVREPKKNGEYFQTHPDRRLWLENAMLVDQDDFEKGVYPIAVNMQGLLEKWLKHCLLVPCITSKGTIFIWPIPIANILLKQRPSPMEKRRREIAAEASLQWTTYYWYEGKHGGHSADDDGAHHGVPKWPQDLTVELIMERAFLNKLICSRDHDIAKIYLGTGDR